MQSLFVFAIIMLLLPMVAAGQLHVTMTPREPQLGDTIEICYDSRLPGAVLSHGSELTVSVFLDFEDAGSFPVGDLHEMTLVDSVWLARIPLADSTLAFVLVSFFSEGRIDDNEGNKVERKEIVGADRRRDDPVTSFSRGTGLARWKGSSERRGRFFARGDFCLLTYLTKLGDPGPLSKKGSENQSQARIATRRTCPHHENRSICVRAIPNPPEAHDEA